MRNWRWGFAVWLLLVCWPGDGRAAEAPAPRALEWRWTTAEARELRRMAAGVTAEEGGTFYLETAHWRVRTWHTPLFTAQAALYMEKFTAVFARAFLLKGGGTEYRPLFCVYDSRERYLAESHGPEWSSGVCLPGTAADGSPDISLHTYYVATTPGREPVFDASAPLATIQHEATHCLLHCLYGSRTVPYWLDEGAACYYGAWGLRWRLSESGETWNDSVHRANRVLFSQWPPYLRSFYQAHPDTPLPRLRELSAANTLEQFYVDGGGELTRLNYALAESFIDYLMAGRKRRPFFLRVLERVRTAPADEPLVTPEEAREHEEAWLLFLMNHWGVKFADAQVRARAAELRRR